MRVLGIVSLRRQGMSPEQMAEEFTSPSSVQVSLRIVSSARASQVMHSVSLPPALVETSRPIGPGLSSRRVTLRAERVKSSAGG